MLTEGLLFFPACLHVFDVLTLHIFVTKSLDMFIMHQARLKEWSIWAVLWMSRFWHEGHDTTDCTRNDPTNATYVS